MAPCRPSRRAYPSGTRGFSLIELMVVVVIVSILTILAVPSLSAARMDQTAYGDAGAITQLFRSARTRAIGWGAAMLISATASAADRGTFMLYQNTIGGVPSTTCGPPTDWSGAAAGQVVTAVDGVNLNGNAEADASLQATIWWTAGAAPSVPAAANPSVTAGHPTSASQVRSKVRLDSETPRDGGPEVNGGPRSP